MSDTWLRDYTFLAFRIDKVVHARHVMQFVTDYYGPLTWKNEVMSEPLIPAEDLVRQAIALADALPVQGFPPQRAAYLEKQLIAMETVCRKLCGEVFSLEEEMKRCFDVRVAWTPETVFEQAHALYDAVLPGTGSLTERLHAYEQQWSLPADRMDMLPHLIHMALAEARKRTRAIVALPEEEKIDIQLFTERASEAYAGYYGNYHSCVAIDPQTAAFHLPRLLDHLICHEGYPGHHTEAVLKEQSLYRNQGYVETALFLYVSPRCVISEGIAMLAHEMIFQPGEAEQWMAAHVYPLLGITVDAAILQRLRQAFELLVGLWSNTALLLDEGRPETEVKDYFAKYMLRGEKMASDCVAALQHPVIGRYNLIYQHGQNLLKRGPDRSAIFRRCLTQQVTPTQLEEELFPTRGLDAERAL